MTAYVCACMYIGLLIYIKQCRLYVYHIIYIIISLVISCCKFCTLHILDFILSLENTIISNYTTLYNPE